MSVFVLRDSVKWWVPLRSRSAHMLWHL